MDDTESRASLAHRARAARDTDPDEASRLAAELRRRFPGAVEGYRIGFASACAGKRWDEACGLLETADSAFPRADWVAFDRAKLARAQGDREGAAVLAAEARARGPDNAHNFRLSCVVERERGRFELAAALVAESLRRFGAEAWVLAEQARLEAAQGRHGAAQRLGAELQALFPEEASGYQIEIAGNRALGDFEAVLATAERAQSRFPRASWPLAERAGACQALGRIEEVLAICETLRSNHSDVETGYAAGIGALRARDRLDEALQLAEEAADRFAHRVEFRERACELGALIDNRRQALRMTDDLAAGRVALRRPRVFVVLGMHRSGSSLAAKLLRDLGVGLGGPLMSGNISNPEGYFEHVGVVDAHEAAMREMGISWDTCWTVSRESPNLPSQAREAMRVRLETIVAAELEANAGAWGFKDPRTLRFLPLWIEIFEHLGVEPVWLLCVRDPRAVAASLFARDRIPLVIGELLWIEHNLEALRHLGPRLSLILRYERWFEDSQEQMRSLLQTIGRSNELAAGPVRQELRHQLQSTDAPALPLSLEFHDALVARRPDLNKLQAEADSVVRRLQRLAGDCATRDAADQA